MSLGTSVVSVLSSPIKMVALTAGLGGVVLSAGGVFTVLNAQASNATAQSVTTGTLKMSLGAQGVTNGLTTAITGMKPGDVQNRFVVLTNTGSLDVESLTLDIDAGTPNALSTSAADGLQIAIESCGVAWAVPAGTCSSGQATELATTAVANLGSPAALSNLTSLASSGTANLRVSISLPNVGECNVNNTANATFDSDCTTTLASQSRSTIQGLTNTLTFKFAGTQPTAGTVSS